MHGESSVITWVLANKMADAHTHPLSALLLHICLKKGVKEEIYLPNLSPPPVIMPLQGCEHLRHVTLG